MEENNTIDNIKFKMAEAVLYDYKYIQDKLDIIELKINKIEGLFLKAMATSQMLQLELSSNVLNAYCAVGREYPELCLGILIEVE